MGNSCGVTSENNHDREALVAQASCLLGSQTGSLRYEFEAMSRNLIAHGKKAMRLCVEMRS